MIHFLTRLARPWARHRHGVLPMLVAMIALHAMPAAAQKTRATVSADALSPAAQAQLAWVRQTADHRGLAFAIIDKRRARMWLFDAGAMFKGSTAVLLGAARGDHSVPGIGDRPMALILPEERTTPAGRFVAEAGRNMQGEDIFWVDYEAAISMHRVRAKVPSQRRLERLASATPADNRISYGCINVPVDFYEQFVMPTFGPAQAVVYVLPEVEAATRRPAATGTQ